MTLVNELENYKKEHGHFPQCEDVKDGQECEEWNAFVETSTVSKKYPTEFENHSTAIEDRPAGTLIYAERTTCFVNTPTEPAYIEEEKRLDADDYAAFVYFHQKGRSCFSAGEK
jgi:hypothetical protein